MNNNVKKALDNAVTYATDGLLKFAESVGKVFGLIKDKKALPANNNKIKGLTKLRAITASKPTFHCNNCNCKRYSPCGCKRKAN